MDLCGDSVSRRDPPECSDIGESELAAAHDVANNPALTLSDDESFWTALENLHEKIGTIVLWKADPVNLDNRREVVRSEGPQQVGRFQQRFSIIAQGF